MSLIIDGFGRPMKRGKALISLVTTTLMLRGYTYEPHAHKNRSNQTVTQHRRC